MSDQPVKPKRRGFFQFSLRTMFLVMLAGGLLLGWKANKAHQQRKAVAWVSEMGGSVRYGYEYHNNLFISKAKAPGPAWLRNLIGIDYFSEVTYADLSFREVSDVTPLERLTKLTTLRLEYSQIRITASLSELVNLVELNLGNTEVYDMDPLAKLVNLERLTLSGTQVRYPESLENLANLTSLDLGDTQVSDVSFLAKLINLEHLDLGDTQVRYVDSLKGLTNLTSLELDGTQVNEESLQQLQQALPKLTIRN